MADARPVRLCDSCGQVDDHPRHVYGTAEGDSPTSPEVAAAALKSIQGDEELATELLRQIMDTATTVKHMDCCSADGCPDGSCDTILRGVAEGTTGNKLIKYLTSGKVDKVGDEINERRLREWEANANV